MKKRDEKKRDDYDRRRTYESKSKPPSELFQEMVGSYYKSAPFVTKNINQELEVKFGTRGNKYLTKIDYDNVVSKLKSLGFRSVNDSGNYLLRIQNEYLDKNSGSFKMSPIRVELDGLSVVQNYCKLNSIKKIRDDLYYNNSIHMVKKSSVVLGENAGRKIYMNDVVFSDFNFSVSYKTEEDIGFSNAITMGTINDWDKIKKTFRYINRVTFTHPDYPVNVDISIVKSSTREKDGTYKKTYRIDESEVFTNAESYEIELEVDNKMVGPGTPFNSSESILEALRKTIKFVLSGLQGTNYPISYAEQRSVLQNYMKLLHGEDADGMRVKTRDFIGPSSFTLQTKNIIPLDENVNVVNIRKNFVVTDKADGERHLMYIASTGKIYLINTNMNVVFTGAVTEEKTVCDSLLDGELIYHDKLGDFINLYAAFDIYYVNKKDVRSYAFVSLDDGKKIQSPSRYSLLINLMKLLNPRSIVEKKEKENENKSPITLQVKKFYPLRQQNQDIFLACNYILKNKEAGLFEYNTDGLIFTPALLGVGSNKMGQAGPLRKVTWEYSFKWKPSEFNTIDFLVTTVQKNGMDMITPLFQDGINVQEADSLSQYKTLELRCGFSEKKHGYINPCQDVIEDKLPEVVVQDENNDTMNNNNDYMPVRFYPTSPYDPTAGICKIMLEPDSNGTMQMKTEENQVFGNNTIVEFKYDFDREDLWRWVPLRVRYDKTSELLQGLNNFGNDYTVADSNWKSIHNPITVAMISSGANIPSIMADEDVYYNRDASSTKTKAMRDFHNLYVKKRLITSVAKKGDTLIDFACGKGGDFSKWISANLSFVFGIDVSKDNLENRLDGACVRFLNNRKKFKHMPYALFVNGDCRQNIRNGNALLNDKALQITKAVFGEGSKDESKLGKGVYRQYGKGMNGFNITSCQFALHYFTGDRETFRNFMVNLAECTTLDGYFIGTSYDGKEIFKMLSKKQQGESIVIMDDDIKIWEIQKEYGSQMFKDSISSLGYKINVFQESINKMIPEFLVNFDYLNQVMEDFGFKLITREEAQHIGLPEGSGMFSELFENMMEQIKRDRRLRDSDEYKDSKNMNWYEKKISFLNRYFVYKKIRNVNASKVILEAEDDETMNPNEEKEKGKKVTKEKGKKETKEKKEKTEKGKKEKKPKIKKLKGNIVLSQSTSDSVEEPIGTEPPSIEIEELGTTNVEEPKKENKKVIKKSKKKLIIE